MNYIAAYSKNFEVKLDSDQYILSVSEHLSEDVLKKEKEIVLTLTATDAYENEAQAVVNIQLPQTQTDAPTFSETVYVFNYTNGSLGTEKDITISNRKDQSLITIKLDCKYAFESHCPIDPYSAIISSLPGLFHHQLQCDE